MDNQFLSYVGAGIIVSVAIFAAYKAGQVFCFRTVENQFHELEFERLKLETKYVLEALWRATPGNKITNCLEDSIWKNY